MFGKLRQQMDLFGQMAQLMKDPELAKTFSAIIGKKENRK